jgi:hypothetical protein
LSRASESHLERVHAAGERLRQTIVDDPVAAGAALAYPIAVRSPAGELDSWFLGLTIDDLLIGFLQLEPDLRLHRYSSFLQSPGETSGCPRAETWLDPAAIRKRASREAPKGEELAEPVLSYHGTRDRLAWRVPVAGQKAAIYVVGEEVFKEEEEDSRG